MSAAPVQHVELDYAPRRWQWSLHDSCDLFRFVTCIVHRRGGKTIGALNELVKRTIRDGNDDYRAAYIAPTLVQATRIAWKPLCKIMRQIPGASVNISEKRWTLPNGSEILLLGVDRFDANRGIGLDYCVLDETALFMYDAWDSVIRPTLADKRGGALFIGTLDEGGLLLDDLDAYARQSDDPAWHALSFDVYQTGVIAPDELKSLKATMSEEAFAREFECKKVGARGAYYAKLMYEVQQTGRIKHIEPLRTQPVNIAADLGLSDDTSLWWYQQVGTEVRILDQYANSGQQVEHYIDVIEKRKQAGDYKLGNLYLPHDGKHRRLGMKFTVAEQFYQQGLDVIQVPDIGIHRGIEAVRQLLPRCWFNRDTTIGGRKSLHAYRRGFNQSTGTLRETPVHDWSSHDADGFRYLAVSIRSDLTPAIAPRTPRRSRSFMAR